VAAARGARRRRRRRAGCRPTDLYARPRCKIEDYRHLARMAKHHVVVGARAGKLSAPIERKTRGGQQRDRRSDERAAAAPLANAGKRRFASRNRTHAHGHNQTLTSPPPPPPDRTRARTYTLTQRACRIPESRPDPSRARPRAHARPALSSAASHLSPRMIIPIRCFTCGKVSRVVVAVLLLLSRTSLSRRLPLPSAGSCCVV
jgi:hypothetical protein